MSTDRINPGASDTRKKGFRLAFVTPVFPSEGNTGGIASYVNNISRACAADGHEAEVFVPSWKGAATIDHGGVRVHRVPFEASRGMAWWALRFPNIKGLRKVRDAIRVWARAKQLSTALEARDRENPFDLVQSTDYWATGLTIGSRPGRPHLVRCSNPIELYHQFETRTRGGDGVEWRMELHAVRRAEIAYAPSKLTADYYARRLRRTVHVCRPPAFNEPFAEDVQQSGERRDLPARYLLHFGHFLGIRKGTQWIGRALPLAWRQAPDLTLLIAGRFFDMEYGELQRMWDEKDRGKVIFLGMLSKAELLGVLRGATATVLPSLVDNLPNCAYESLRLGIPVIGTRGASIDELVEDGVSGELVDALDEKGLAEKMVGQWRGESLVRAGFTWDSAVAKLMEPRAAVDSLLRLAGLCSPDASAEAQQTVMSSTCA